MADTRNDSHLSQGGAASLPEGPTRMQHRRAMGDSVNGMTNPNGAERGPTDVKVGNAGGKTY